jgi:hypothetical protein
VVPNNVPAKYAHKMEAWVRSKTTVGRYIPVDRQFARGTAALGVVVKDHYDMVKVGAVHNLSRHEGVCTNDGIDIGIVRRSRKTMAHSFSPTRGHSWIRWRHGSGLRRLRVGTSQWTVSLIVQRPPLGWSIRTLLTS